MGIMAVSTGISLVIFIAIVLVIAWVIHEHL
jgi:hypothetical protein